jgi:hypothetical protein
MDSTEAALVLVEIVLSGLGICLATETALNELVRFRSVHTQIRLCQKCITGSSYLPTKSQPSSARVRAVLGQRLAFGFR